MASWHWHLELALAYLGWDEFLNELPSKAYIFSDFDLHRTTQPHGLGIANAWQAHGLGEAHGRESGIIAMAHCQVEPAYGSLLLMHGGGDEQPPLPSIRKDYEMFPVARNLTTIETLAPSMILA